MGQIIFSSQSRDLLASFLSMNYIRGSEREEMLLLPEALEDYIAPENPVRFIDAFVSQLDLQAAGFARAQLPSRPTALRSGRSAAALSLRLPQPGAIQSWPGTGSGGNLELIWLLRKLRPDFKTIADFRRENEPGIKGSPRL